MAGAIPGSARHAVNQQAKAMAKTAQSQMGIGDRQKGETVYESQEQPADGSQSAPAVQIPQPQQPFDAAAYKQNLDRETGEKLAALRKRLREIEAEMQGARYQRQQNEQAYEQRVDEQLGAEEVKEAQKVEVQQKQGQATMPVSVKAKQGSSEAGRRSRKG